MLCGLRDFANSVVRTSSGSRPSRPTRFPSGTKWSRVVDSCERP